MTRAGPAVIEVGICRLPFSVELLLLSSIDGTALWAPREVLLFAPREVLLFAGPGILVFAGRGVLLFAPMGLPLVLGSFLFSISMKAHLEKSTV